MAEIAGTILGKSTAFGNTINITEEQKSRMTFRMLTTRYAMSDATSVDETGFQLVKGERPNFLVSDVLEEIKEINLNTEAVHELTCIYIAPENRRKGIATSRVTDIISKYPNDVFVCASAALMLEYPDGEPSSEEYGKLFSQLHEFYTSLKFVNVNTMVGQYESKVAYLYTGNKEGAILASHLMNKGRHI